MMPDRDHPTGRHVLSTTMESSPPPRQKERLSRLETYLAVAIGIAGAAGAAVGWLWVSYDETRSVARQTARDVGEMSAQTTRSAETLSKIRDDMRDLVYETRALARELEQQRKRLDEHTKARRHGSQ